MAAARIVVEDATGELLSTTGAVTFGNRTGSDVVLDDPGAADRHCTFDHDGSTFRVRDLGSVSGTWLDGQSVGSWTELGDGAAIVIGMSRIGAKVEERDGAPALVLTLQRNAFWWRKSGKKVFDNDPDALVRSEVGFGAFPLLRVSNRAAMVLGAVLLIGGLFVSALLEPLADAGPLLPTHAVVTSDVAVSNPTAAFAACRALSDEQGCNVCHTTGAGAPESKCAQCHGDLKAPSTWRHPYLGDGDAQALPGLGDSEDLCVVCHRDHQGSDFLKPAAAALLGDCRACHGQLDEPGLEALKNKHPATALATRLQPYSTIRFPHDAHVVAADGRSPIDCTICHVPDANVQSDRGAGLPDDPDRHDFVEVPYETCASCHVTGAPARGMTASQQEQWRAKDAQWAVTWHGTDNGGKQCLQCHRQSGRGGRTVFGPEFATVARGRFTPEQHATERARYTTPVRQHTDEFAAHANGRECTECHLNGAIAPAQAPLTRTFWHALHTAPGALQPPAAQRAAISTEPNAGCVSCHQDMRDAQGLLDANVQSYHWPATQQAEAACKECHREAKDQPLPLRAADTTIAAERRAAGAETIQFPHDVHVGSKTFGASGTLAEGCFSCHEFVRPEGGSEFELVPRTKPGAADCSSCHTGHANVGGGECRHCHPADDTTGNSFLASANVVAGTQLRRRAAPAAATRDWPGKNPFSHFSRGHSGPDLTCATCHDAAAVGAAKDLRTVPLPDDATKACRDCHLQKQFHWR